MCSESSFSSNKNNNSQLPKNFPVFRSSLITNMNNKQEQVQNKLINESTNPSC